MSSQPDSGEYRGLIGKLCDGTLPHDEWHRLNELLQADPFAMQSCMDHLFIDALLEREFAGLAPVAKSTAELPAVYTSHTTGHSASNLASLSSRRSKFSTMAMALLMCVTVGVFTYLGTNLYHTSSQRAPVPLVFANAGFESLAHNHATMIPGGGWFGDQIAFVDNYAGIDPLEGERMLHWEGQDGTDNHQRTAYQLIDLQADEQPDVDGRPAVFASANFNTAADEESDVPLFGVRIYAFAEKPVRVPGSSPTAWGSPLAIADRQLAGDFDEESWQKVTTQLHLPQEARYLVVELSVIQPDSRASDDQNDHFVDKVSLGLVSSL